MVAVPCLQIHCNQLSAMMAAAAAVALVAAALVLVVAAAAVLVPQDHPQTHRPICTGSKHTLKQLLLLSRLLKRAKMTFMTSNS